MSYKIVVETDNHFRVCCGEFESFAKAKKQLADMITEMFDSLISNDFCGCWDKFLAEFPEEIRFIIFDFQYLGCASAELIDDGVTDSYRYIVTEQDFRIFDCEDGMFAPLFSLETNMLNLSDDIKDCEFRLWSSMGDTDEGLTIRLIQNSSLDSLYDDEDTEGVEVYDIIPDDVRSRLGALDLEDEDDQD